MGPVQGVQGTRPEGPRDPSWGSLGPSRRVPKGHILAIPAGTAKTSNHSTVFCCFLRKQPKDGARVASSVFSGIPGGQLSGHEGLLFQNSDYEK